MYRSYSDEDVPDMSKYIPDNPQVVNIYKWERMYRKHLMEMHDKLESYAKQNSVPKLMVNLDYTALVNYLYDNSLVYWKNDILAEYRHDYTE